jgi:hypothetical protein
MRESPDPNSGIKEEETESPISIWLQFLNVEAAIIVKE